MSTGFWKNKDHRHSKGHHTAQTSRTIIRENPQNHITFAVFDRQQKIIGFVRSFPVMSWEYVFGTPEKTS